MIKSRHVLASTALLLTVWTAFDTHAAGFALKEQSALALGSAFSGATAGAEDLSHAFFNPAALSRFDGVQAQIITSYIRPVTRVEDAVSSNINGDPLGGRAQKDDIGEDEIVPAFYGLAQIHDRVRLGLAVNVPFGLETRYPGDWAGRYHGVKSELLTVTVNPMVAVDANSWLSVGGGLVIQYADAELTNAIDFGTALQGFGGVPGQNDGFAKMTGDGVGVGFNLGLLAEPVKGTRLGVGFRSEISQDLDGNANFSLTDTALDGVIGATGQFVDTDATARLKTPASVNLGIFQEITDDWAVMGEAQWTQWSTFDELTIEFDNPLQADNVTEQEWDDQWFFALGTRYKVTDTLGLRIGVAYDQKAVKTRYRTPRIPDSNRYWVATGLEWQPRSNISISLGYTHIFIDDADVRLRSDGVGNATRGNLDASYESHVDIVALSGSIRF